MVKTNFEYYCQECGRGFKTAKAAQKASFSDSGCPGCGGSDIDVGKPQHTKRTQEARA